MTPLYTTHWHLSHIIFPPFPQSNDQITFSLILILAYYSHLFFFNSASRKEKEKEQKVSYPPAFSSERYILPQLPLHHQSTLGPSSVLCTICFLAPWSPFLCPFNLSSRIFRSCFTTGFSAMWMPERVKTIFPILPLSCSFLPPFTILDYYLGVFFLNAWHLLVVIIIAFILFPGS